MRIRKIMIASIFMLSIIATSIAQSIGIKSSVQFSTVGVAGINTSFVEKSVNEGFDITIFGTIPVTDNFSFQPELSYNEKGFEVGQGVDINLFNVNLPIGVSAVTDIKYVQVPLLGRYEIGGEKGGVYFLAGPSVALATRGNLRTKVNSIIDFNLTNTEIDITNENYNRFELAGQVGTGAFLNIGSTKLFAEVKYHHGFTDLLADPILDIRLKNRSLGVGAGLQYSF